MRLRPFATLLFLAILTPPPVLPLEITCDYNYPYDWHVIGKCLTCTIKAITVTEKETNVTKVSGNFPPPEGSTTLSYDDVKLINIIESECNFIPRGFENFFPNLQGIRVAASKLSSLTLEDLAPFKKLKYVDMFHNHLDMLDSNLFALTPDIEYVYFGDNKLKYIGYNIFKPIPKLWHATFHYNTCIHKNAFTKEELPALVRDFHAKCLPNEEVVDRQMCDDKMKQLMTDKENLETVKKTYMMSVEANSKKIIELRSTNADLLKKTRDLESTVARLKNSGTSSNADIEDKVAIFESENENLKKENWAMKEEISAKNTKISKLEQKLEDLGGERGSSGVIWFLSIMLIVGIISAVGGFVYLKKNLIFKSGDDCVRLN